MYLLFIALFNSPWHTQCWKCSSLIVIIMLKCVDLSLDSSSCTFKVSQNRNSEIQTWGSRCHGTLLWLQKANNTCSAQMNWYKVNLPISFNLIRTCKGFCTGSAFLPQAHSNFSVLRVLNWTLWYYEDAAQFCKLQSMWTEVQASEWEGLNTSLQF